MSRDVKVKEEPIDFECSPFELLNEIGQNDDVTQDEDDVTGFHAGPLDLSGTQPVIKHEHQGIVKTEITIGAQYDEECTVVDTPSLDHDVGLQYPSRAVTSSPRALTSSPRAVTRSFRNELQPGVSTETEHEELPVLSTEPVDTSSNLAMKLELPAKYKTLFDGAKAFPEMAKEILPIIEELVHFHNCICLLRRDLNLHRCQDCGKGFVNASRIRIHARHCVVQKLENRFAPASITRHVGPTLEDTETESLTPSQSEAETKSNEGETGSEVQDNATPRSRQKRGPPRTQKKNDQESDPDYSPERAVTVKREVQEGPVFRVTTDPVTGEMTINKQLDAVLTPHKGKRKRTRKPKEDREFEKGTCWGMPTKTSACRITRVVEHNQFNQKKINPYHVFRYYGEVLYHNAIPMSLNFQGTAQNVFNTMISSIVEVGKLVPITKGRRKYIQVLQKQKPLPPPDLELLPTPAPQKCSRRSKTTSVAPQKQNKQQPPPFKKIKIVCQPKSSAPVATSSAGSGLMGIGNRRTKSIGVPPLQPPVRKPVKPGLNFDIGGRIHFSKTTKALDVVNPVVDDRNSPSSSACSAFDPTPMDDKVPAALQFNRTAVRDHLKEKLQGYLDEENFKENYVLEDHTVLFLENFMMDSFINAQSVMKRVNKILKDIQDTIPDSKKADLIHKTRANIADIIEQENYAKIYRLDSSTIRFMESFAFGVANPSGRDIARANEIVDLVGVRKLREKLVKLCEERCHAMRFLDVGTRVFIENFTSRVRPDKLTESEYAKINEIITHLKSIQHPEKSNDGDSNKGKDKETVRQKDAKICEESSSSDSINESDLSSPEIMRSCSENLPIVTPDVENLPIVTPDVDTNFQPSVDLKCLEELSEDSEIDTEVNESGSSLSKKLQLQIPMDENSDVLDRPAAKEGDENDNHEDLFEKNMQTQLSCNNDHFVSFCSVFVKKCKTLTFDLISNGVIQEQSIFLDGESLQSAFGSFCHPVIAMIPAIAVIGRLEVKAAIMKTDHDLTCFNPKQCLYKQVWDFIHNREFRYLRLGCISESLEVTDREHQNKVYSVLTRFKNALEYALDTYLLSKFENLRIYMAGIEEVLSTSKSNAIKVASEEVGLRDLNALMRNKSSRMFMFDNEENLGRLKTALVIFGKHQLNLKPIFVSEKLFKQILPLTERILLNGIPINSTDLQKLRTFISGCMTDLKFLEKMSVHQTIFLKRFHRNELAEINEETQYHQTLAVLDEIYEKMDQEKEERLSSNVTVKKTNCAQIIPSSQGSDAVDSLHGQSLTREIEVGEGKRKPHSAIIIVKKANCSKTILSFQSKGSVSAEPSNKSDHLDVSKKISGFTKNKAKDSLSSEDESSDTSATTFCNKNDKRKIVSMQEYDFSYQPHERSAKMEVHKCDIAEALLFNEPRNICTRQQMVFNIPETQFSVLRVCKKHLQLGSAILKNPGKALTNITVPRKNAKQIMSRFEQAVRSKRKATGTQTMDMVDTDNEETGSKADDESHSKHIHKDLLVQENAKAKEQLKKVTKSHDWLQWRIGDLERQLEEERQLRSTLSNVTAQWQDSNKILKESQEQNEERISKLQQDNKELHGFVARSRKSSADSRRSSADTQITIKQLQADIEELKKTNSEVQTANTEMYQNLCKKSEEVKSLEVSIQSISEALRLQTKTISTMSRKNYESLVEEHNGKVLGGYESLVAITCKVLGEQQSLSKQKIEDPVKMREICESVAGDENLFSIFMRVFCGNNVCKDEAEVQATEKRVLFLMNLMTYFYNGTSGEEEVGEEEEVPSSSRLSSIL